MNIKSQVYWYRRGTGQVAPLTKDASCQVVIVGGGMAGLCAAQALAGAGKHVILLEREFCGSGASGKSSGFITPDSELELSTLIENYGPNRAKRLWEFVELGVGHIRKTIENYTIDCDYQVQDSFFVANSEKKFRTRIVPEH